MDSFAQSQFSQNMGILTEKEVLKLQSLNVLVVGLGGLGGNVVNGLIRLGITSFALIDFDTFDTSNLNRQLFSNHDTIGMHKCDVVKKEITKIYPKCKVKTYIERVQSIPLESFESIDYIIDAVDNLGSKKYIATLGKELNIPVLHGACAGWYGQVGWIMPGCNLIEELYLDSANGLEKELLNPSFTPSVIAGYMVSEFVKLIKKSDIVIMNELLLIDLYNNVTIKTGSKKD